MRNYYKIRDCEALAVVRAMLNEQSFVIFPKMTERQRTFIQRMMAVCERENYAVPRRFLRMVRPPRPPRKS